MNIEQAFQAICENPEDDGPRLEYAKLIEKSDPDHAQFIRWQIQYADERRHGVDHGLGASDRDELLPRNKARWANNIAKFAAHGDLSAIDFDRGFPIYLHMHPDVFVEYADFIFRLAPIRIIDFVQPYDEDGMQICSDDGKLAPFPMDRLLACPQLSRLDSFGFVGVELELGYPGSPGDVAKIAKCPHLTRCESINFRSSRITAHDYLALAEGALTGKMLEIGPRLADYVGEHRVHDIELGKGEYIRTDFSDEWKAVEQRLGYIPWLHPSHNARHGYDLRWHLEHGNLPKYPAGSPPKPEWYEVPTEYPKSSWW